MFSRSSARPAPRRSAGDTWSPASPSANYRISASSTNFLAHVDGSYFQIAQDIKNLVAKDGVELQITSTKGSLENIQLLGSGKVDLAIVQLDAPRFVSDALKQQKDLDVFDKIKVVLNLYPEEIHVLSNKKEIQSFYHLEGKRVSVIMGLDIRDEKHATQMQRLVLSILNGREYLEKNGHAKWKSSIIQTYFPMRGYEPTNQVIQIFNVLDNQGYKIVKK